MNASVYPITNPDMMDSVRTMGVKRMLRTGDTAVDSGMAFLVGELEKIDPKIREPLTAVTWSRDIVAKTGGGWVEYTSMMNVDYATPGANDDGIIGGETNAIPVMQADYGKDIYKVFAFGSILKIPFVDQAKLQTIGRSLQDVLDKGVRLNYQKALDKNVYTGYSRYGSTGLVNDPSITAVSAASTGTGSSTLWSNKTPDNILADINKAINDVWAACQYDLSGMPNHILLPPVQYADLVSRKVSDAGNISVLKYLEENNVASNQGVDLVIVPCRQCTGAGTDNKDRMVVYRNEEDKVYFDITVPLTRVMTQPSVNDMAYLTAYAAQHGVVKFAYHETARYVDGI
jgi:hypothetical protein